jgi:DNA phosphorothioation-associated putative methyltransferase
MKQLGKHVDQYVYVHEDAFNNMPAAWQQQLEQALLVARECGWSGTFNVAKLHKSGRETSLLHYPRFLDVPFPSLRSSVHIDTEGNTLSIRDYSEQENPPILHRKELLLPIDDPRRLEWSLLTAQAEAAGLFDSPKTIGTRRQWLATLAARGFALDDGELVPLANELNDPEFDANSCGELDRGEGGVARHRTALSRTTLSAPTQALIRRGLLNPTTSFFDYGCGRGDDVAALRALGIDARGWDPYFARTTEKSHAAVVNIGFVINVIEDRVERCEALREAFELTTGVLSVAAMLAHRAPSGGKPFADGYFTTRRTFQKYYNQAELGEYIAEVLNEPPIAIAQGVYFVFKDADLRARILEERYTRRPGQTLPIERPSSRSNHARVARPQRPRHSPAADRVLLLEKEIEEVWQFAVHFGRTPDDSELPSELRTRLEEKGTTATRCVRLALRQLDTSGLQLARARRSDDTLVLLAVQRLSRRGKGAALGERAIRDARAFFGGLHSAQVVADGLLKKLRDEREVLASCQAAYELGLGWLQDDQLQFATSLLIRLPVLLRIYVAASTLLLGPLDQFDILKIHARTGKVSLMQYEKFDDDPVPALQIRVKVNLRTQKVDEYAYGRDYPAPLLFHKSRYMDKSAASYGPQLQFEGKLNALCLLDGAHEPSAAGFHQKLRELRWEISDGDLVRSHSRPSLDDSCGTYLRYRDLIQCGETIATTGLPNLPVNIASYNALLDLAKAVIDPVIEYFGAIRLTYGFCSSGLARMIKGRIAPRVDQHCAFELSRSGTPICARGGAACDFIVEDENMFDVAEWIYRNTPVDRIYVYGANRPIHVSFSEVPTRAVYQLIQAANGKLIPRKVSADDPAKPLAFDRAR